MKTIFSLGRIGYIFVFTSTLLGIAIYLSIIEKTLGVYITTFSIFCTNIAVFYRLLDRMKKINK
jgi:hypothetical protein